MADFLPAGGAETIVEQVIDLITVIGNAQNVTAVIDRHTMIATLEDLGTWQQKKQVALGAVCYTTADKIKRMECTVAGVSGTSEPNWPAVGKTVVDGTVTWKVRNVMDAKTLNGKTEEDFVPKIFTVSNNYRHIADCAQLYLHDYHNGTLKLTLEGWTCSMSHFKIKGYHYEQDIGAWEVLLGGYNYNNTPTWNKTSAILSPNCPFDTVRFCKDSNNKPCILLGNLSTQWSYEVVSVEYIGGNGLSNNFQLELITTEDGIVNIGMQPTVQRVATINVGEVKYFTCISAPSGYLKANGALLKRTDYPGLFAFAQASGNIVSEADWGYNKTGSFSTGDGSTTFRIPDLRGEFIRGLDDGRGIDAGRVLGSLQPDDFKSHTHNIGSTTALNGSLTPQLYKSSQANAGDFSFFASGTSGGTETRPRNIALLACIKY